MKAVPFRRLEEEVLALYQPPYRRKSTWFKVRRVLKEFRELPGVKTCRDIVPLLITRWLAAYSHRAPMTNRSYLSSFRAACNYAKKMGYIHVSPWEIRRDWITFDELEDDDEPTTLRHLTMREIELLLDQVDAEALTGGWAQWRLQALVYLYVHTGMRKMEALGLKVDDVLLNRGLILLRGRRQRRLKTRQSARRVGIPEHLDDVLHRWIPRVESEWLFPGLRRTKPWISGSPGSKPLDAIKAVAKRAGVEHVTIQSFRRSIATHAKVLGLGQLEVRDLLGHSTVRTQEWYVEEDADGLRDLASRIRFRPKPIAPPASRLALSN